MSTMGAILKASAIVLGETPAGERVVALKRGFPGLLKTVVLGGLVFYAAGSGSRSSFAIQASDAGPERSTTMMEIACAELTVPCHFLCQDAQSKESKAVAMEKAAEEARNKAEEAVKKAAYYENRVNEKNLEAQQSESRSPNVGRSAVFWKMTYQALKFLVPPYARHSYEPGNISSNSSKRQTKQKEKEAINADRDADEAWMAVDQAMKTATESKTAAVKAWACAEEARRSFEACLCR